MGKTKQILYIAILNVIIFIILAYFLIPPLDTLGYGAAFLIVELNAIVMYFAYSHSSDYLNFEPLKIPLAMSIIFTSITLFIFFQVPENYLIIATVMLALIIIVVELLLINDDDKRLYRDIINLFRSRFGKKDST